MALSQPNMVFPRISAMLELLKQQQHKETQIVKYFFKTVNRELYKATKTEQQYLNRSLRNICFLTKQEGKEIKLPYFVNTCVQKSGRTTPLTFPRQRTTKIVVRGMVYKANDPKNCSAE